jgi:hypothetical protein
LDGGVNALDNPVSYSALDDFPISIANPSKVDKSFFCWLVVYANGNTGLLMSGSGLSAGTTGDLTLTAIWA